MNELIFVLGIMLYLDLASGELYLFNLKIRGTLPPLLSQPLLTGIEVGILVTL